MLGHWPKVEIAGTTMQMTFAAYATIFHREACQSSGIHSRAGFGRARR